LCNHEFFSLKLYDLNLNHLIIILQIIQRLSSIYKKHSLIEKVNVKLQFDFTENAGMITSQSHTVTNLLHFGSKLSNV